jgi:hypothetical protein
MAAPPRVEFVLSPSASAIFGHLLRLFAALAPLYPGRDRIFLTIRDKRVSWRLAAAVDSAPAANCNLWASFFEVLEGRNPPGFLQLDVPVAHLARAFPRDAPAARTHLFWDAEGGRLVLRRTFDGGMCSTHALPTTSCAIEEFKLDVSDDNLLAEAAPGALRGALQGATKQGRPATVAILADAEWGLQLQEAGEGAGATQPAAWLPGAAEATAAAECGSGALAALLDHAAGCVGEDGGALYSAVELYAATDLRCYLKIKGHSLNVWVPVEWLAEAAPAAGTGLAAALAAASAASGKK